MLCEGTLKQWPRERVQTLLEHDTQHAAARAGGISRSTLLRLLEHYGIEWKRKYCKRFGNAAWQELGR